VTSRGDFSVALSSAVGRLRARSRRCRTEAARVWDQDIMRHSFASYWLAVNKNAPELAEIMGNSVPIIRRYYENTVLEAVALHYWSLVPE